MEEEMKLEMQALIEKHLPAQTGMALKQLIERGQRDSIVVAQQVQQIEKLQATVKQLEAKVKRDLELEDKKTKLDNFEKELDNRNIALQIKALEYQLQCEKDKTKFTQDVAMGLVRNTEYRKNAYDSKSGPYIDNNGYQQYATHSTNSSSEEKAE